jgi:hypothetical protein
LTRRHATDPPRALTDVAGGAKRFEADGLAKPIVARVMATA